MEKKNKLNINFKEKGLLLLSMGVSLVLVSCAPRPKKENKSNPLSSDIAYIKKDLNFSDEERSKREEMSGKGKLAISYTDINTNDYIIGAKISVTDSKGKVIANYITDGDDYILTGLKEGKTYTLTELSVPDNYNDKLYSYEIQYNPTNDQNLSEKDYYKTYHTNIVREPNVHELFDSQENSGKIIVVAFERGEGYVPGVGFKVVDSKGLSLEEWTSTTRSHTVSNLEDGEYHVIITDVPEGYKLDQIDGEESITIYNGEYDNKTSSGPIYYFEKEKVKKRVR